MNEAVKGLAQADSLSRASRRAEDVYFFTLEDGFQAIWSMWAISDIVHEEIESLNIGKSERLVIESSLCCDPAETDRSLD